MTFRRRPYAIRPGSSHLEAYQQAFDKLAREREALSRQLQRCQLERDSLERQLEERLAENHQLRRMIRALEARVPASDELEAERERRNRAVARVEALEDRVKHLEAQIESCVQERDEALAARDRMEAALRATEAELDALRHQAPDRERAIRLAADLANLRRHQREAIERGVREQTDRFLLEIASVRDAVERAVEALPDEGSPWHDGLSAVLKRIDSVLEREGVQLLGAPGERFDPRAHEAVGTTPAGPEGYVVDRVSSGLARADGSIIAPARVVVGGGA